MYRVTVIATPLIALAFGGARNAHACRPSPGLHPFRLALAVLTSAPSFVVTGTAAAQTLVATPNDDAQGADAENYSHIRIRWTETPARQNIPAKDANVQANNGLYLANVQANTDLHVANVRIKYGHWPRQGGGIARRPLVGGDVLVVGRPSSARHDSRHSIGGTWLVVGTTRSAPRAGYRDGDADISGGERIAGQRRGRRAEHRAFKHPSDHIRWVLS